MTNAHSSDYIYDNQLAKAEEDALSFFIPRQDERQYHMLPSSHVPQARSYYVQVHQA